MAIRTIADVEADYALARAAYHRALDVQSFAESSGEGSVQVNRAESDAAYRQMKALEREHRLLSRNGIPLRGVTPLE